MIKITHKGDFKKTEQFLKKASKLEIRRILEPYAKRGVDALSSATPVATGATAASWGYEIKQSAKGYSIYWTNTHQNSGVYIAVILQYGHGTGTGGYVQGRDYINPAMRHIFDDIADAAWKEITKL